MTTRTTPRRSTPKREHKNRAQNVQHALSRNGYPRILKAYTAFGAAFPVLTGDEAVADSCWHCGVEKHLYVNTETGQYDCKSCGKSGNVYTFLRMIYSDALKYTKGDDYKRLSKARDIPVQTLKRWGLAFDHDSWLLPAMSGKGEVLNLTRYYESSGEKRSTSGLELALFGVDQLSRDSNLPIFLTEGLFDGAALDAHLRQKRLRSRYDILAVPGANSFKEKWCEYLRNRVVRIAFDNDQAGFDGQRRVAAVLRKEGVCDGIQLLKWPRGFPEGYDLNDLLRNYDLSFPEWFIDDCEQLSAGRSAKLHFIRADKVVPSEKSWLCAGRVPGDSLVTLDGDQGVGKSTIARYMAAKVSAGKPMFGSIRVSVPASDVFYFTSEDDASTVRDIIEVHGGDLTKVHIHTVTVADQDGVHQMVDLIKALKDLENEVTTYGVKLLVIDAANSFIGAEHDVSSDAKARRNVTGLLHSFAQRNNVCILAIRHWAKGAVGDSDKRGLGPSSLQFICRGTMWVQKLSRGNKRLRACLHWSKVSDAPTPCSKMFRLVDKGGHKRKIEWMRNEKE